MSRIIPRNLIKHLEWNEGRNQPSIPPSKTSQRNQSTGGLTGIVSANDFWTISGVQYRGESYKVDLAKNLLDGGSTKTQNEWANYSQSAMNNDEFRTPDYPLLYGILRTLYSGKNDALKSTEIQEAQKFLKDTSRAKWLMTLTRIAYQPSGDDKIFHNYSLKDQYEENVDFITPDEWIKNTSKPTSYQKLLGTEDTIEEINNVFQWLNGTDAYAWKVNSKPKNVDERVAGFNAGSDWADLGCDRDPAGSCASLGVRVAQKI